MQYFKIAFFAPLENTIRKSAFVQHLNHQNPSAFYMVFEIPGFPNSGPKIHFWASKKQSIRKRPKMESLK